MLLLLSAFLSGAVAVLLVEGFILYQWFKAQPNQEPKLKADHRPVTNPKEIADYCSIEGATTSESCMFLNLIFQFLWREWRDAPKTRNYFIRKLNMEFKEMLLNKTAGKLMEQITVSDYYLGDSLPVFRNATVMKLDTRTPSQVPREIDIAVDLEYLGGFILSLDVDLIFGKSAHLTVKLNSLSGRLRLQLTRNPCTHWSFSFYEDPLMELKVESNFEGKNLPKLTTFISNQIRRSIKKKHTLPNYKVRYKPFFVQEQPQDGKNEVFVHNSLITVGRLDVEIVECTRLPTLPKGSHIYCTLSLDSLPWKEDMPMKRSLWPVHEVLICRAPSGAIGVSFFQQIETVDEEKRENVLIKTVTPNSPASQVDIERGDILISVNNVDIDSMKQAVRLIKNAGNKFTFKLQRPPSREEYQKPFEAPSSSSANIEEMDEADDKLTKDDSEDSFDFNRILLSDEDSETEEFVDIVVHEIEKELNSDEATRQFINEVKMLRRASNQKSERKQEEIIDEEEEQVKVKEKKKRTFSFNFRKPKLGAVSESHAEIPGTKDASPLEDHQVPVNTEVCIPGSISETSSLNSGDGWYNISPQTSQECVVKEKVQNEEEKEPTGQKTSIVGANQEPVWNEIFSFDTEKEHKFLNICVWGKCIETFEKDVLLGYVSIPLMDLSLECLSTNSRKSIQTFLLAASSSRSAISRSYLRVMTPGLNASQCNGDITLAYKYVTAIPEVTLRDEEVKLLEEHGKKKMPYQETGSHDEIREKLEDKPQEHNFIGTDFYFPTRCEYCQNKVWRKVAFQCRVCAMVCHKRCLQKAQSNTYCTSNGVRARPPVWQKPQDFPDAPTMSPSLSAPSLAQPSPSQCTRNSWTAPDISDLRPGTKQESPSKNILRRRKESKSFGHIPSAVNLDQANDSITRAAETAKEAGREFFASLEDDDKESNIQKKLEKLQEELTVENEEQSMLKDKLLRRLESQEYKQKIQILLRKSEERGQALSLLMIQYCAALNECLVDAQPQQCDL